MHNERNIKKITDVIKPYNPSREEIAKHWTGKSQPKQVEAPKAFGKRPNSEVK